MLQPQTEVPLIGVTALGDGLHTALLSHSKQSQKPAAVTTLQAPREKESEVNAIKHPPVACVLGLQHDKQA